MKVSVYAGAHVVVKVALAGPEDRGSELASVGLFVRLWNLCRVGLYTDMLFALA